MVVPGEGIFDDLDLAARPLRGHVLLPEQLAAVGEGGELGVDGILVVAGLLEANWRNQDSVGGDRKTKVCIHYILFN